MRFQSVKVFFGTHTKKIENKKKWREKKKEKRKGGAHTHTHTADFLDFFAHLRVKSNEALDVDEIFLEE